MDTMNDRLRVAEKFPASSACISDLAPRGGKPRLGVNAYQDYLIRPRRRFTLAAESCSFIGQDDNEAGTNRPHPKGVSVMKLGTAIAEIMKREGIEILTGYPVNHLIEYAASADIRPVMVRQERTGVHMADAISRVTSGE